MSRFILLILLPITVFAQGQNWLWIEGAWRNQEGDGPTGYPIFMEMFHHEIHEGDAYIISGYSELDTNDSTLFWIETPASIKIHMVYEFNGSKITTFEVFQDCDSIPKGATTITPRNADHNSSNTTSLTVKTSSTLNGVFPVASLGTHIDSTKIGSAGAAPSAKYGGQSSRQNEEIYETSTIYCFPFFSGEDSNILNFIALYYENTDKY